MPYVKRDATGVVVAVSIEASSDFSEQLSGEDPELAAFIGVDPNAQASIDATDKDFVRVLEDVVQLLIDKGVILFTDLPPSAQEKIMRRQRLRSELTGRLDLIGED